MSCRGCTGLSTAGLHGGGQDNEVLPRYGVVRVGRRSESLALLLPSFVLVLVLGCPVGPALSLAFPVGHSMLPLVDGCGLGCAVVLHVEPLGDILRGTVPLGGEAVSAKKCGVPLSSTP